MKKYNDILFHPGNCLNNKKPYARECVRCIQNCPHGAIDAKKVLSLDQCTECGICTAVCPSDGFVYQDMKNLKKYLFNSQEIILNCPLAVPVGYEITCLGILDRNAWTTLLLLAGEKQVKIVTGHCMNCQDQHAGLRSIESFEEINRHWPMYSTIMIEDLPALENALPQNTISFTGSDGGRSVTLRERGKDKIKMLFPSIEAEETYDIPVTRQWLKEALAKSCDKRIPFMALIADENCTNCDVCAKICPQNALNHVREDSKNQLVYEPLKCVQCSRCVEACGPKALKFSLMNFSGKFLNGRILLIEPQNVYCKECGMQLFLRTKNELCMACTSRSIGNHN